MKKILWIGEYLNPTGLSRVSRSLTKYLKTKYTITFFDYHKVFHGRQIHDDMAFIGPKSTHDVAGFKALQNLNLYEFDAIMMIADPWGLDSLLKVVLQKNYTGKVFAYYPIDAEGQDPDWYKYFYRIDLLITYTNFAKEQTIKAAPWLADKIEIVPHGIDQEIFFQLSENKQMLREKFFGTRKFSDAMIFLNAHRNQPRKRLDITMKAFGMFSDANPKADAYLYMHCGVQDSSMDVIKLANRYNISDKLILTGSKSTGLQKVSDKTMNTIYNICDFGINTSMGEGWGLPNTEHAATGAPQLVPNHSACRELFQEIDKKYLGLINIEAEYTIDKIMTIGKLPSSKILATMIAACYQANNNDFIRSWQEKTREEFTKSKYKWENIAFQFYELFEQH